MVGRLLLLILAALALSACNVTNVDVRHVRTDKGYLNSRLAAIGDLYIWNRKTGFITQLAEIELSKKKSEDVFTKLEASQISGFELIGTIPFKWMRVSIEARVRSSAIAQLSNAQVVAFTNTFNDMSNEINARVAKGEQVSKTWFLDDAIANNSPYRYLLIYRVVKADKTVVKFENTIYTGGEVTVPIGGGASAKVIIDGFSSSDFEGNGITTLVNYYVIKAFLDRRPDGTQAYAFRVDDSAASSADLSATLRTIQ